MSSVLWREKYICKSFYCVIGIFEVHVSCFYKTDIFISSGGGSDLQAVGARGSRQV